MYGALEVPLIDGAAAKPGTRTIKAVALATPIYVFLYLSLHLAGFACVIAKWGASISAPDANGWNGCSWAAVFTPFWIADSMALVVGCFCVGVFFIWKPERAVERDAALRILSRGFLLAVLGSVFLLAFHVILCQFLNWPAAVPPVWCLVPILALVLELLIVIGMCGSRPRPLSTICLTVLFAALILLSYRVQEPATSGSLLWSSVVTAFALFEILLFSSLFLLASKHLKKEIHLSQAQACSVTLYTAALIMVLPSLISCASLTGVPEGKQHSDLAATLCVLLVGLSCAEVGFMITLVRFAIKVHANDGDMHGDVKVPLVQTSVGWVPETRVAQNWLLVGDVTVIDLLPQHALQQRKIKGRCCHPVFSITGSLCRCWIVGEVAVEVEDSDPESELRRALPPPRVTVTNVGVAGSTEGVAATTGAGSSQGRERADSGTYTELTLGDDDL
jgi:hypothetical protein